MRSTGSARTNADLFVYRLILDVGNSFPISKVSLGMIVEASKRYVIAETPTFDVPTGRMHWDIG